MLGVLTLLRRRRPLVSEVYAGRQFVGMDLHRRRSVLVRMTEAGEHLETVRILNDRDVLAEVMSRAGESPEVVLEATYGWYWAADALAELGATVHLAHPLGVKAFSYRRVKNDLLTELSASSPRRCVRRRARLARFTAREQRCGCAARGVRAGGAAGGFAGWGGGGGGAARGWARVFARWLRAGGKPTRPHWRHADDLARAGRSRPAPG